MPAPPLPFLPAGAQGTPVVLARACYAGPGEGEAAVRALRDVTRPLADLLGPMPYPEILDDETPDRGLSPALQTAFVDRIDEPAGAAVLDRLDRAESWLRLVQIRVLGGAVDDVGPDDTAYPHRGARVLVNALHGDRPDPAGADGWCRAVVRDLHQGHDGAYVNFLGPQDYHRVDAAYPPPTLARLRAVKATHDPANLFRSTIGIGPAPDGGPS